MIKNSIREEVVAKHFSPFSVHEDLENLAAKDEEPNANYAEYARLESVITLMAILEKRQKHKSKDIQWNLFNEKTFEL